MPDTTDIDLDQPVAIYYLHRRAKKWRIVFDDRTLRDAAGILNTWHADDVNKPGIALDVNRKVVASTDHPEAVAMMGMVLS